MGDGLSPLVPIAAPLQPHEIVGHSAAINAAGLVAFAGTVNGVQGLFTGNGGPLTTVVEAGVPQNGLTVQTFLGPPAMNDAGQVAFVALNDLGLVWLYQVDPTTGPRGPVPASALGGYPQYQCAGGYRGDGGRQ